VVEQKKVISEQMISNQLPVISLPYVARRAKRGDEESEKRQEKVISNEWRETKARLKPKGVSLKIRIDIPDFQ